MCFLMLVPSALLFLFPRQSNGPADRSSREEGAPPECYQAERRGPTFVHEPPRRVDFSNSTGATVACAATGSPEPRISWTAADGSPVEDVRGLRYARPNGSLVLPPFRAEDYRQDVHATVYRCAASNPVGAVVSRDVHVRAGGPQHELFASMIRHDGCARRGGVEEFV
ncbi:hypothetical protein HPB48_005006 [Haemaphysalis longicornis]|uniref:Ig-like domain-containing protein n=1 Tax=Haemaphysalis longicornis TaxID=44386 RepID=A0A9J6GCQ5_HAELO|nr:hypothetical protein HPB48_005006 [Haemaphysalis longicornis]